jgi:hypothetical protein
VNAMLKSGIFFCRTEAFNQKPLIKDLIQKEPKAQKLALKPITARSV